MTEMSGQNWNVDTDLFRRTTVKILTIFKERFLPKHNIRKDRDEEIKQELCAQRKHL